MPPFDHDAASGWRQGREADGDEVFLPPPGVRGDVARAMFYFSIRYPLALHELKALLGHSSINPNEAHQTLIVTLR